MGNLLSDWKVETDRSGRSDTPKDVSIAMEGETTDQGGSLHSRGGSWAGLRGMGAFLAAISPLRLLHNFTTTLHSETASAFS